MSSKVNIIPRPNKMKIFEEYYSLNKNSTVSCRTNSFAGEFLMNLLGLKNAPKGDIRLEIDSAVVHEEGYFLRIDDTGIVIKAGTEKGLFYGAQTLRQIIYASAEQNKIDGEIKVNYLEIEDEPRYSYRGFMFDSVRHFFDVETIMSLLDLIAMHKLNRFHWHLTDDQGFRIEIDKYPKLAEIASKRKESQCKGFMLPWTKEYDGIPHSGIYTKDQIRKVVAYAKKSVEYPNSNFVP